MINWKRVVWIAVFFYIFYTAPTEGNSDISLTVVPKIVLKDPYRRQTFRLLIRIPEHPDNRRMSWGADCGANASASQRDVEGVLTTVYLEMRVTEDCIFYACVHRVVKDKVKNICVTEIVKVGGD